MQTSPHFRVPDDSRTRKEAILARHSDLRVFVADDLGVAPVHAYGKEHTFHCWDHEDHSPSLSVGEHLFYCHSARCGHGGDLFSWVGWRHNLDSKNRDDFLKILALLDGNDTPYAAPSSPPITPKTSKPKKPLTAAQVLRDHQKFDAAMQYFGKRAISEAVGRQFYLGARIPFALPYETAEHRTIWMKHNRYAIPTTRGDLRNGGKPVSVALRYDDREILSTLYHFCAEHEDDFATIRADLAFRAASAHKLRGEPLPDIDDPDFMVKRLYGKKYHNLGGVSQQLTFNADYLVDWLTLVRIPRDMTFIVEGQADAMALISAGYPAVALPLNKAINMAWLFEKVDHVCIIRDNDEAGTVRANTIAERIRKPNHRIITPQHGKDANDECINGTVHQWLGQWNYEPLLLTATR